MKRSVALILLAATSHAAAQDVYTTPLPGARVLERTTTTQRIVAGLVGWRGRRTAERVW